MLTLLTGARSTGAQTAESLLRGTPTFFIGLTQGDDSVKSARSIRGAQPYVALKQAIDSVLGERQ